MILPKVIFTDIDGVWTDGSMYYDELGNELKRFNTSDSFGILLCKLLNIIPVIISGENSKSVMLRAKKLEIKNVYLGAKNKLEIAELFLSTHNIELSECAFIGDDFNDFNLLAKVGYSGTVPSAPNEIKKITNYTTKNIGGNGAFREFVEHIIQICDKNNDARELIFKHYKISQK